LTAVTRETSTPAAKAATKAQACLARAGVQAAVGPGQPGNPSAPDAELTIRAHGIAAFVALYNDSGKADRLVGDLARNAKRFGGSVDHRGDVTVVWTKTPTSDTRSRLERCVFA
jgi:hypothetical protein